MKFSSVPDKQNSTYYHHILLDNGRKPLFGWSCEHGRHERLDKIDTLTNAICRLYASGYINLDPPQNRANACAIQFYRNKDDLHLVTMYKRSMEYECDEVLDDPYYEKLRIFLDSFYGYILKNESPSWIYSQLYVKAQGKSVQEKLNPSNRRFATDTELRRYANALVKDGIAQGLVEAFVRKYRENWFSDKPKPPKRKTQSFMSIQDIIDKAKGLRTRKDVEALLLDINRVKIRSKEELLDYCKKLRYDFEMKDRQVLVFKTKYIERYFS